MVEVYLNGKYIGNVSNPEEFVDNVITERRKNVLDSNLNVLYNKTENIIKLESEKGRLRRPLIVVKDGKSTLTEKQVDQLLNKEISWDDLLKQGVIEYLDALEEENALVGFSDEELTNEHTHLEIAPMSLLGLAASLVPFGNHNASARLNAGTKNQKQALGFYASNYLVRMDMDVSLLDYPQKPLCNTIMHNISKYDKHPAGQNIVVAIMSYKGYNMDDAIILNGSSIQRGLARSTYYKPLEAEELRYSGGLLDEIGIPDKDVKGYRTEKDYRLLDDDGIIHPEAHVAEGDVIIGKTSPPRFLSNMDSYNIAPNLRRESSISMEHGSKGVIDFVLVTENSQGNKLVQVRLRDRKIPEIGDKFTSRHGQKGVIGMIVPSTDMPFTSKGVTPDLIFNPHGIPSRMTIAHLIELVGGKVGSMGGRYIDGTTFEGEAEQDLREELASLGFKEDGTETLYNGITGEMFEARIFIGNMYYLKLKHMVSNKIHSRARGPIQLLTRQPTEGRAKEGGLRLGEMEKDTFVAHGASMLLKERFDSDRTIVPVCETSGLTGYYNAYKGSLVSPIYGEEADVSYVEMSYAFKLFLDELKSLCIYPKIDLGSKFKGEEDGE